MSGPWPHPDSGIFYFRKETPADLKRQKGRLLELGVEYRSSIHRSLETRDPKQAAKAYSAVLLEVDAMWQGWRELLASASKPLDHIETAGLVREMVASLVGEHERDPASLPPPPSATVSASPNSAHSEAALAGMTDEEQNQLKAQLLGFLRATSKRQAQMAMQWAKEALHERGPYFLFKDIAPDVAEAVAAIAGPQLAAVEKRLGVTLSASHKRHLGLEAAPLLAKGRQALGAATAYEFRPLVELKDQLAAMPKAAKKGKERKEGVSISSLYELWKRDHEAAEKAKKTAEDYRAKLEHFIKWLGHDDAQRVTKGHLWEYCDRLRHEEGLSAKTIQGKYLTCIKAIFRKGFERDLLKDNVAASVRYTVPKKVSTRSKGYTDEEARSILAIADASLLPPADGSRERRSLRNRITGRWVPWLCCYTGARVAEITQLRKEDITEEQGIWCLKITPEAGSVKTGQYRLVPLHPHLVEIGFLKFVEAQSEGPLFYDARAKRTGKSKTAPQEAADSLARWIKGKLGEAMPKVQPNHAWRHRFKTVGREAGLGDRYLDAIQGHSDGSAAAAYGETTVKALYREICKLPVV